MMLQEQRDFLLDQITTDVLLCIRLLKQAHLPKEIGYYEKPKLKLRATPRQMTNYGLAIDLLCMCDQVSEDPTLDRKILWLRAKRNSFVRIGKYLSLSSNNYQKNV